MTTMRGFTTAPVVETLRGMPLDRIRHINWLRIAVQTGLYHVPADVVAGSILRRLSLEDGETWLPFTAQQR